MNALDRLRAFLASPTGREVLTDVWQEAKRRVHDEHCTATQQVAQVRLLLEQVGGGQLTDREFCKRVAAAVTPSNLG